MPGKHKVYWDSCVFLDWMKQDKPDRVALIQQVVDEVQRDEAVIVTSALTLVEVVRLTDGRIVDASDEKKIVDFMKNPFIEVRVLDRKTAEMARTLQRGAGEKKLSMPKVDSVHIATALLAGVHSLHTFDDAHMTVHSGRWGTPPLTICWPSKDKEDPAPLFRPPGKENEKK